MTVRACLVAAFLSTVMTSALADELQRIRVSDDGTQFVFADSGKRFIPYGFNYDHEGDGKLIEDYWVDQWPLVESAFAEMKQLGANVVRIHLQFGKLMNSPTEANQASLDQLSRLLKLAEKTGLYLDITGLGCYHKQDVPAWYDELDEQARWNAQTEFWKSVANTCVDSPAVFCYDLMNEPVVGGGKKRQDWLGPGFGGKHFVQFITLDTQGRPRHEIARQWTEKLVAAIRQQDEQHMVTIGLVPWSLNRPGMTSGFDPQVIAEKLDFIAMHLYPEKGKVDEAIETVKGFAAVGKPVVIEEIFVLKCSADELSEFIDRSQDHATGWIGFYWGKTPEEYRPPKTLPEAFALSWLELFQEKRDQILNERQSVPRSVESLWTGFDPRAAALDAGVVREWEEDGITYRYVTFHIGTFKDKPARMAAFYAFPKDGNQLPGLIHLHGGGQRAFLHEVKYYAQRGYACLSINWGGREMENAEAGDPNTDWGSVDPTQQNVPGYFNLMPGEKCLDADESPRNNNWYLLTIGARRGLTFLEQQGEVDTDRLGVYGHSMGGNLTVYVAGTDDRVKVAAPSAGGQGFRTVPWKLLPEQNRKRIKGDVELFRKTLGFQAYAPHINAPLLWLGATNDFHGIMDDTYRTGELIPGDVRYSFAPHLNHRFTPPFAVTRPLWIDQHLKGSIKLPVTPTSELTLTSEDHVPTFSITPGRGLPIERVHVYYSIDPDPQARFWRSAKVETAGEAWTAKLSIMDREQPLFAFANVHYRLENPEPVPFAKPTETLAISSRLHTASPDELKRANAFTTDKPSLEIDDFKSNWRNWYKLSADNPHHWQYWTRKISDPKWQGRDGYRLELDVKSEQPNQLVLVLTENFFRSYRGKSQDYVAVIDLKGGDEYQQISLAASDFKTLDAKETLQSWAHVDLLGLRPYHQQQRSDLQVGSDRWAGPQPRFRDLRWIDL